jgi:hypothetical protein
VAVVAVMAGVMLMVDSAAVVPAPAVGSRSPAGQAPPVTGDATVQPVDQDVASASSSCYTPNHVRRSHWKWCSIPLLGPGVSWDLVRWWQVAGGVWYCRFRGTFYGAGSTPIKQDLGYQTVRC